jgi:hypothetical protein
MAMAERELHEPDMTGWSQERKVLWALVKREGTKVTEVARAVGYSHSTISQYIGGTYASPQVLDPAIRNYLISIERWQEEDEIYIKSPNYDSFPKLEIAAAIESIGAFQQNAGLVVTRDFNRVLGICRCCWEKHEMGLITGDPGTGKTFVFQQLDTLGDTPHIIITCDETNSVKSTLVDICEALDLPIKGASPTLVRRIVKHLRSNPCLLIFDEADLLKGVDIFETIRAIYDKAGTIGVVLCGNNNLAERILMYAEGKPELARLRDRIGYFQRLTGLSEEEARQFVDGLNCTQAARRMLIEIGVNRGTRQLIKAIARCQDATAGDRITEELVEELGSIVLSFCA